MTPTPTPAASAHAPSMQSASPSPPSITDILNQVSAIERTITEAPKGSVPAIVLRPFLTALREHFAHNAPLQRVEAKLDKISAALN